MSLPGEIVAKVELGANRLAAETVLATPGKDDGLIPAYSLLTDLADLTTGDPDFHPPIEAARLVLDKRLDLGQPFDADSLQAVLKVVEWLQTAITAHRGGKPIAPPAAATGSAAHTPGSPGATDDSGGPHSPPAAGAGTAEELLVLDLGENRELLTEFHAETAEHLQQIEAGMLKLEGRPDDPEALNAVFRSFHTIKGNSGFLGLKPMHLLAHEVETLLDLARNRELVVGPAVVTQILRSRDAIDTLNKQVGLALEKGTQPDRIIPVSGLITAVKELIVAKGSAPAAVAEEPEPAPAPEEREAAAVKAPEPVAAEHRADEPKPKAGGAAKKKEAEAAGQAATATVRVSIDKLDNLMDVVGELVIVHSQLAETSRRYGQVAPGLQANVTQLNRITKELQSTAMSLRMIPIQPTFQKMERLARDLSRDCRKAVSFTTRGGDTELDRTMVEEIADPLVHMVRNALDHGLEGEEERVAKGKPPIGSVELRAFHQGGQILIELQDDGRGLDPDKILAKARRQGLIPDGPPPPLEQIHQLIFLPGFSTAEKVTALSGRGVGMDVVKRNVERLRGKIDIASTLGKGTTFTIRLPLTMAIIDGLVVRVGEDRFILPTTSVQRALRPTKQHIVQIQGCGEVLDLNGKMLPLHRLNRHFGIPGEALDPWDGILVIVETSGRSYALLVDEMISKQEVVIKNLGAFMANLTANCGVAGGAILGDGHIALILDPGTLLKAA